MTYKGANSGEPRKSEYLIWGKGLALALSIAVITIHILSGLHTIYFFVANVICVILSFVSLVGPFLMSPNFRKADLTSHSLCCIVLLVSGICYLVEVHNIRRRYKQNYSSLPIPNSRWRVNSDEAIAAGVTALVQSLLHAILVVTVWLRRIN